ncbi:zinc finger protein 62 homolog isoform X2 [Lucilia sericata]|nr:zinc finger protein 62 homolog isoform X2 [Lucilia sericata]XP_037808878.1 zinc finger protein 62 homolog isoform X2 [Lucilia sericata]
MDITIKMEVNNIKDEDGETNTVLLNEIKEEDELIIESDEQWIPIKFEDEQNDYYQEYCQEFREDVYVKNESSLEHYKIEYLDENEDNEEEDEQSENFTDDLYELSEEDEDDYDYEGEDDDTDDEDEEVYGSSDNKGYAKDISKKDHVAEGNRSNTNSLCKITLKYWLLKNHIQHVCPECNKNFATYKEMLKHIKLKHKNAIEEAQNEYVISEKYGTCKKCQREYKYDFNRYRHTVGHRENSQGLRLLKCKMCSYKTTKYIQTHFVAQHPDIVKEYKKLFNDKETNKCPICHYTFVNNPNQKIWHHFMDKHPQEYKDKFLYNCHLCQHERFADEQLYLNHLMVEHDLNCWKKLNFRKIFADKEYLACGKCHIIYLRNDTSKLLKHYLEHDNTIFWSCRFCGKKRTYRDTGRSGHMCTKMISYYTKQYKEDKGKKKIKNLQEFEEYMAHVCPFCKEEFNQLLSWQEHLRSKHAIDTPKGLEMKVAAADNNKLHCNICHSLVANTPVQLHSHRFKHLPFKAYKCRHCKQSLATFKRAVNHLLKGCNGDKDINQVLKPNMSEHTKIEIQCAICNYQKFAAVKDAFDHYQDKHNNFEEFFTLMDNSMLMCIVCHEKFSQNDQMLRLEHVFTHFDEKIYKCPFCPLSYVKLSTCNGHKSNMHYYKPIEKPRLRINKKDLLNENQRTAAQSNLPQTVLYSEVLNEFAEFISFACPVCNESMSNQKEWHTHITTQHDIFEKSKVYFKDSDGSLKCPTCKTKLKTCLNGCLTHTFTHMPYRPFSCNLCYIHYNSLTELYRHCRRRHFVRGTYKCPNCPEVLATPHQQTEHLKEMHPLHEWPVNIQCSICFEIFESESALKRHLFIHYHECMKCDTCGSKTHSKKKRKSKFKVTNCDDSPSVSGFKESTTINPPDVREDWTDLNNVGVKSNKVNLNNKRKADRNNSDVMEVTTDLDNVDVITKKSNVNLKM